MSRLSSPGGTATLGLLFFGLSLDAELDLPQNESSFASGVGANEVLAGAFNFDLYAVCGAGRLGACDEVAGDMELS